ncbi:MAG: hypothetical protein ACOCW8_02620 [bacterium]
MSKQNKEKSELTQFPGKNPFSVPRGYFDSFYDRLQDKVYREPGKQRKYFRIARSHFALAAAILGFAILSIVIIRSTTNKINPERIAKSDFFTSDFQIIDEYLLEEYITHTPGVAIHQPVKYNKDALLDYLEEQDLDEQLIIENFKE